jgi:hypothetical protein
MASYTLNDIKAASPGYPTAALERRIHPPCNVKLLFVPDPAERGHPEAMWVTVTAIGNAFTVLRPAPARARACRPRRAVTFEGRHITVMPLQDPGSCELGERRDSGGRLRRSSRRRRGAR